MPTTREGNFYGIWPVLDGKSLNMQWGEIRSNQAETKAIVRNTVQELETGVDELNALRALLGQEYGDLDFRNKYRLFYDKTTREMCCQKNTGTVDSPSWTDSWCVRFDDGQFRVVSEGGVHSAAGFYGTGLQSIQNVGETGSSADSNVANPTRIFFNADDGFNVTPIASGQNVGQPEITFTQPFGKAQTFERQGKMWQIDHAFGTSQILVQVMNEDDQVIIPDKADLSDPNTAYFYFNEVFAGKVLIASGGIGAASLVPRDPFYMVVRADDQDVRPDNYFQPSVDMIFDSKFFYVGPDQDLDNGGHHKTVHLSLTDRATNANSMTVTETDGNPTVIGVKSMSFSNAAVTDLGGDAVSIDIGGVSASARFNDVTAEGFYVQGGGELGPAGLEVNDGSAASPSVTFVDDDDTGLYRVGADALGLTAGGVLAATISTDHVRVENTLEVENIVTAEAFYLKGGGEISNDSDGHVNIAAPSGSIIQATPEFVVGEAGTEESSITVGGSTFKSSLKSSDIDAENPIDIAVHKHSDSLPAVILGSRSGAVGSSHADVADGDELVTLYGVGWNTDTYEIAGQILIEVDGIPGAGYVPGAIKFLTNKGVDTGLAPSLAMTIGSSGHVRMEDSLDVENTVTAEGFYLAAGSGGELSKSGDDVLLGSKDGNISLEPVFEGAVVVPDGRIGKPALRHSSQAVTEGISWDGTDWIFWLGSQFALRLSEADVELNSAIVLPPGNASVPSYTFSSDSDTGIYRAGADALGVAVGGAASAVFRPASVEVSGIVRAEGFYTTTGEVAGGVTDHGLLTGKGDDDHPHYTLADGTRAFTGDVDLGGNDLTGIGVITGDNHFTGSITAESFYTKDGGAVAGAITVKEVDGDPNVTGVTTIRVTNGTLTDDGAGQVTITTGGGGGSDPRFNTVTAEGFYVQGGGELSPEGVIVADGSASAPSISFNDDRDTGIYRPAANELAISVGGVQTTSFRPDSTRVSGVIEAEAFYFTTGGEAPQSYVENFSATVEWIVNHNLARTSFIAQAYKSIGTMVIPDTIDVSDPNTAYFYFTVAQAGKAVILGIG